MGINAKTVNASFWNVTTSGQSTSSGGTGMTTAQMQTEANFISATSANGNKNPDWNFTTIWYMTNGVTYPLLQGLPAPAVTANEATATHEGSVHRGGK